MSMKLVQPSESDQRKSQPLESTVSSLQSLSLRTNEFTTPHSGPAYKRVRRFRYCVGKKAPFGSSLVSRSRNSNPTVSNHTADSQIAEATDPVSEENGRTGPSLQVFCVAVVVVIIFVTFANYWSEILAFHVPTTTIPPSTSPASNVSITDQEVRDALALALTRTRSNISMEFAIPEMVTYKERNVKFDRLVLKVPEITQHDDDEITLVSDSDYVIKSTARADDIVLEGRQQRIGRWTAFSCEIPKVIIETTLKLPIESNARIRVQKVEVWPPIPVKCRGFSWFLTKRHSGEDIAENLARRFIIAYASASFGRILGKFLRDEILNTPEPQ